MKPRYQISRSAIDLIKRFEGYRQKSAQLPDGRWTIGYGHTLTARRGAEVTEPDAEALLIYDLIAVAHVVNEHSYTPLTQNQFDALCAFAFNIGADNFRRSAVLRRVNEGQLLQAANAMEMWRKADFEGERIVIDALVRRRSAEKSLFLLPAGGWIPAPSPVLPPKIDVDSLGLMLSASPAVLTTSLDGDRTVITREDAPAAVTVGEAMPTTATEAATSAVTAQLSQMLRDPERDSPPAIAAAPEPIAETFQPIVKTVFEDDVPEDEASEVEDGPLVIATASPDVAPEALAVPDTEVEPEIAPVEPEPEPEPEPQPEPALVVQAEATPAPAEPVSMKNLIAWPAIFDSPGRHITPLVLDDSTPAAHEPLAIPVEDAIAAEAALETTEVHAEAEPLASLETTPAEEAAAEVAPAEVAEVIPEPEAPADVEPEAFTLTPATESELQIEPEALPPEAQAVALEATPFDPARHATNPLVEPDPFRFQPVRPLSEPYPSPRVIRDEDHFGAIHTFDATYGEAAAPFDLRSLAPLLVLAVLGLIFFGAGVFWGFTASGDGGFSNPLTILGWALGIIGIGFFGVAIYLMLNRLVGEDSDI
jgi:lysozyme